LLLLRFFNMFFGICYRNICPSHTRGLIIIQINQTPRHLMKRSEDGGLVRQKVIAKARAYEWKWRYAHSLTFLSHHIFILCSTFVLRSIKNDIASFMFNVFCSHVLIKPFRMWIRDRSLQICWLWMHTQGINMISFPSLLAILKVKKFLFNSFYC